MASMSMPRPSWRLLAEPMEARILHSADLAPLAWAGAAALHAPAAQATLGDLTVQRSEIVFVDASLSDARGLVADLQSQRSAGRSIEIVTIDAGVDGLALIGATLAARHGIGAVHVLAHGSDGRLQLGSMVLDEPTLLRRADELAAWSHALTGDADLLLYGCDLAASATGQRLVQDLAALTGADVAASTDLTGAAMRGGDWTLEYATGHIEASLAPSPWEQAQWQGVLATYTVTSTVDVVGASLLPGTLRWAIGQANANVGTDTIVFAANGTFNIAALVSGDDTNKTGDFDVLDSVNIVGNGTGNTIINGNGADRVFDVKSGTVSFSGLTIQGGASSSGAGLRIGNQGVVTLTDVVVQNNVGKGASQGGGIYDGGILTLRNVVVRNNGDLTSGDIDGAGIFVATACVLDASDVEIRDNISSGQGDGGGLYLGSGFATISNSTIAGNRADNGGGVYDVKLGNTLVNVTLSGNSAAALGGGLYASKSISLDHVTVAGNTAGSGNGGGAYDTGGQINARNSLFANNSGGNTNTALISQGYNLSDDNSAGFVGTGDQKNVVSAGLLGLADNGGFTRTHAIGAGSAARDAANPVPAVGTDQRGIATYGGRADVGAYEYNPNGFAPTIGAVANQVIDEDATLAPIAFTIGDAETNAGSLVVTATSSNTALVPDANIVLGGSGSNRTISLTPAANANSSANGGPATITLAVSDGVNVTSTTFAVTVQAVNDAPTVALPAAQTMDEGTDLVFAGANAITVSDVDAGAASLQVTLTVAQGKLKLNGSTGLAFVVGNGNGNDATMTFTGSLVNINAALNGMKYKPADGYNGPERFDIAVNDLGNSGSGGAASASGSLAISVIGVNSAPVLGLPGAQSTPQPTPLSFSATSGNAITVADVDAGSAPLQITLSTVNVYNNGKLSFGTLTNVTLISGSGTNDTTVVLRGSATDLNAALDSLTFKATAGGAARIDVGLDDLGNTGSGGPLQTSGAVAITVGSDALPVLTLGNTTRTFTEGNTSIRLDPSLSLTDSDNATLASARVSIGAGYAGAEDVLAFTNDGSTMGNIAASYSAGVLTLTSAGETATVNQWQSALRSVTYANASTAPSTAPRTLTLTVSDGIADSAARQIVLSVVAVNDAPVLTGANDLGPIVEDTSANGGTLVSALIAGHISDADDPALAGIAVVAVDDSRGSWQYTVDGGTTWSAFGTVNDGAARLLAADASSAVRFVPNADWNGTVAGGIRFRAWDQTDPGAGGVADTSISGGSAAFSSATVVSRITVMPVNDAPTLATPIADQSATQGAVFSFTVPPGTFGDIDAGDTLSYTATLASGAALPAWLSFDAATQTFSGTPANADVGAVTLRVVATDGSGAAASGDFVLTVGNVNDAPTLAAPIADQSATQGTAFSFTVPPGTFGDIDAGDTLSYTATLASGAALPAWLSFDAATQTFSGTPANADVGAVTLRVVATDGSGAAASGDFALTVGNVNDAPTLATPIADQSVTSGTSVTFGLPQATFADPDAGDVLSYQASLASGAALPAWLQFDAARQVFTAAPQTSDLGRMVVRVTATDPSGATAQALFAFIVADPAARPQVQIEVTLPEPAAAPPAVNGPVTQPAAAAGPASTPVSVSAAPRPAPAAGSLAEAVFPAQAPESSIESRRGAAPQTEAPAMARPSSRVEAVLAAALIPQYADLTAAPLMQLLRGDELMRKLEEVQRQMSDMGEERRGVMASSIALTSGLSIGYVVWLVRGGVLVSSMLSALPAWQMIDPLPVLAAAGAGKRRRSSAPSDEPEVERLFDERSHDAEPGTASASAPAPVPAAPSEAGRDGSQPMELRR